MTATLQQTKTGQGLALCGDGLLPILGEIERDFNVRWNFRRQCWVTGWRKLKYVENLLHRRGIAFTVLPKELPGPGVAKKKKKKHSQKRRSASSSRSRSSSSSASVSRSRSRSLSRSREGKSSSLRRSRSRSHEGKLGGGGGGGGGGAGGAGTGRLRSRSKSKERRSSSSGGGGGESKKKRSKSRSRSKSIERRLPVVRTASPLHKGRKLLRMNVKKKRSTKVMIRPPLALSMPTGKR